MTSSLDATVRAYIQLALMIERHQPGYVDAYFGPPEWREQVNAGELLPVAALKEEAEALAAAIEENKELTGQRRDFLTRQIRAIRTTLRLLAGETLPLEEEVENLYDITPTWTNEAVFEEAHQTLDELLPPGESLIARLEARKKASEVTIGPESPLLQAVMAELRRRTQVRFPLPPGEAFEVAFVTDKPWSGYNWYLGGFRSRIEINVDVPINIIRLVDLIAHEAYPGHHTELSIKEAELVQKQGWLEHSLIIINSSSCVIAEGIATRALSTLMADEELIAWNTAELFPRAGLDHLDARREQAIETAYSKLDSVAANATFLLLERQADEAEVSAYLQRYGLKTEKEAARTINFIRYARSYTFTYDFGGGLLDALFTAKPERDYWFRRLLSEAVTPSQVRGWFEPKK